MSNSIGKAFNKVKKEILNDEGYATAWQANIAMCCYDAMREEFCDIPHEDAHHVANKAAKRFMKICFDWESEQC